MIPTINKVETGRNIKKLLQQKCIMPNDIKEYLNLSCVQTVYRWLEGINIPSVDNLYAISRLLDVSMDDLVKGTGDGQYHAAGKEMQKRLSIYHNRIRRFRVA